MHQYPYTRYGSRQAGISICQRYLVMGGYHWLLIYIYVMLISSYCGVLYARYNKWPECEKWKKAEVVIVCHNTFPY